MRSWNSKEHICSCFAGYANRSTVTKPAVKALFGFSSIVLGFIVVGFVVTVSCR